VKGISEGKYKATCNRVIGALIIKTLEELNNCREVILCYAIICSYTTTLDSGGTEIGGDRVLELIMMAN